MTTAADRYPNLSTPIDRNLNTILIAKISALRGSSPRLARRLVWSGHWTGSLHLNGRTDATVDLLTLSIGLEPRGGDHD